MGDSGASRTLLREDTVSVLQSGVSDLREEEKVDIVYGGGERGTATQKTNLGEVEALLYPGLKII